MSAEYTQANAEGPMEPMKIFGVFIKAAGVYRPPTDSTRILPHGVEGTFTHFMLPVPKPARPMPPEQ